MVKPSRHSILCKVRTSLIHRAAQRCRSSRASSCHLTTSLSPKREHTTRPRYAVIEKWRQEYIDRCSFQTDKQPVIDQYRKCSNIFRTSFDSLMSERVVLCHFELNVCHAVARQRQTYGFQENECIRLTFNVT